LEFLWRSTELPGAVDAQVQPCHICRVKTKKSVASGSQHKSSGMKLVEKYRPRMSRLSDFERQKLMVRGLQINTAAQAVALRQCRCADKVSP
jgi:hypothetical protein